MKASQILDFWLELTAISIVVAAILTALHIVLRKDDVRAATGWLGLVWLTPLVGVVLYWILGVNRIRRRAHELYSDHQPIEQLDRQFAIGCHELRAHVPADSLHLLRLAQLTDRVTRQPLIQGNAVALLENGDSAYPKMLESIESARDSVALCTYIFDNDHWGQTFRQALSEAAARGVEVRVLIDAVGARYSFPPVLRALKKAGIPAARFMPSLWPWRFRYANLRNHRKILVCDGRIGYTGGMNIRSGNVLADNPHHPIVDLHCEIRGPAVAGLQSAFADDWQFATGERLTGRQWYPALTGVGDAICRGIPDGPDEDFDKLHLTIMGALACARDQVVMVTPYFLPDERLNAAIKVTALRGVDVRIVIPARSNLKLVEWASTPGLVELLDAGCRIYRTPPPFDHTKLMLVDNAWVLLGSANIDSRSLVLNFEFNVECYAVELAASTARYIDDKLVHVAPLHRQQILELPTAIQLRNRLFRLLSPYL